VIISFITRLCGQEGKTENPPPTGRKAQGEGRLSLRAAQFLLQLDAQTLHPLPIQAYRGLYTQNITHSRLIHGWVASEFLGSAFMLESLNLPFLVLILNFSTNLLPTL
jgi:hypothetical protein